MSYNYRTRIDKIRIQVQTIQNTVNNMVNSVKEYARHYELIERPEVNWVNSLPAPGETSY